jgi:hypothetical protein
MRLSSPLLAVKNASDYVHIFSDVFNTPSIYYYWETCSYCEQRLIKAYGFTMKTPNGVNVGLDYVGKRSI